MKRMKTLTCIVLALSLLLGLGLAGAQAESAGKRIGRTRKSFWGETKTELDDRD